MKVAVGFFIGGAAVKSAIVVAALFVVGCGGSEDPPPTPQYLDGQVHGVPPPGVLYPAGTIVDGCKCALDEGNALFDVTEGCSACASSSVVSVQCDGDVPQLCPCAVGSLPFYCSHNLPAGAKVVLRKWVCQ